MKEAQKTHSPGS